MHCGILYGDCFTGGCTDAIFRLEEPDDNEKAPKRNDQPGRFHGTAESIEDRQEISIKHRLRISIPLYKIGLTDQTFPKNHHRPLRVGVDDRLIGHNSYLDH